MNTYSAPPLRAPRIAVETVVSISPPPSPTPNEQALTTPQASRPSANPDETRRILRKIDVRLLPVLACIYAFALIDRVNLPNARIAGMDVHLQLSVSKRYSLMSMMFFVPYVIF